MGKILKADGFRDFFQKIKNQQKTINLRWLFLIFIVLTIKDMPKLQPSLYQTNRFGKIVTPHNHILIINKGKKPCFLPLGKEFMAWRNIKGRCLNKNNKSYKHYGGRGIKICDRWKYSYRNFLLDMGQAPGKTYSIDRINNNGNYEPGNCRWATMEIQANNRRNTIIINYDGETKALSQWSKDLKISYRAAYSAIKLNNAVGADQAFIDFLAPKSRIPIIKVKKRQEPKYYHDLQEVITKYALSPLGFRYNSNLINKA